MDLKTYQGSSMAEALEQVKKDLGREAVILHTRTVRRGGWFGFGARTVVEITASRNVNVLHPTERRTMLAPESEPPARVEPSAKDRSRGSQQEPVRTDPARRPAKAPAACANGAARGAVSAAAPAAACTQANPTCHGEITQLRGMVRELLNRPTPAAWGPNPDVPEELRDYYTQLIQSAVADEIAADIIARAKARLAECRARLAERAAQKNEGGKASPEAGGRGGRPEEGRSVDAVLRDLVPVVLLESIEKMLPETDSIQLPEGGGPKLVALVGPTGVGKTTTIAKLAAYFKLRERKSVGLITIDTYRIAAVDQLRAYAEILNIPLQVVLTPEEMATAVDLMRDFDVVLIDTSGRSQNDVQRLSDLKVFLDAARTAAGEAARLETHLVLSCTSHPTQLLQVAEKFSVLGVDRAVFTKLDEAVGLGVILNVSYRLNLRLSYLTTGQDVPEDMEVGHRRRVAELILNRAEVHVPTQRMEHVA